MRQSPKRASTAAQTKYPTRADAQAGAVSPADRAHTARWRICALIALSLSLPMGAAQPARAGAIYKIVDSEGRVTYSAKPPVADGQRVQQLKIHDGMEEPPEPAQNDAVRQEARVKAVAAAQQAMIRAKAALEQAKIQSPEDWETKSEGRRVLSAAYFNRVSAAEAEVEMTERALEQARK